MAKAASTFKDTTVVLLYRKLLRRIHAITLR